MKLPEYNEIRIQTSFEYKKYIYCSCGYENMIRYAHNIVNGKYEHKCNDCGRKYYFDEKYPKSDMSCNIDDVKYERT